MCGSLAWPNGVSSRSIPAAKDFNLKKNQNEVGEIDEMFLNQIELKI